MAELVVAFAGYAIASLRHLVPGAGEVTDWLEDNDSRVV
jgi:hypothetical protein